MMTDPESHDVEARLARKAVIARELTDPLGRRGFRRTGERLEREARARRAIFVGALGSFAAALLIMVGTAEGEPEISTSANLPSSASTNAATGRASAGQTTVNRAAPKPHKRTRSS